MTTKVNGDRVAALADRAGCLTMLALDHRESLRTMLGAAGHDDVLAFKRAAIRELGGMASAVLLDRATALDPAARALVLRDTAIVLAADRFDQPPGSPVLDSRLDDEIDADVIHRSGAAAIKLLVLWRPDRPADQRADDVSRFVALARRAGVAALVEGIVTSPEMSTVERNEAKFAAAEELCSFGPDVYKAELPGYIEGDLTGVAAAARRLTGVVRRPWVVLSNGVRTADFVAGVRAACSGGASGFLAGRAVWRDVAAAPDREHGLRAVSAPRLRRMIDVTHGRD